MIYSSWDSEVWSNFLDVKKLNISIFRMIRRGDDPDKPRERHIKTGAFIKVEKEEKAKKSADQIARELIGDAKTEGFMKTDFTHNVQVNMKNAEKRAKIFNTTLEEIAVKDKEARENYMQLKKASSM